MTETMKQLLKMRDERETVGTQVRALMSKSELSDSEQAEKERLQARCLEIDKDIEFLKASNSAEELEIRQTETERKPEETEFTNLLKRSRTWDFVSEAVFGSPVEGASRELRQELGVDNGFTPIEVFYKDDIETRADAVTNIAAADAPQDNQQGFTLPVRAESSAGFLGIQRPTVPPGTASYPAITTGPTADYRSDGVAKDADALAMAVTSVDPVRLTSRVKFGIETPARVPGFEAVINPLLRSAIDDKLDSVMLQGQAEVSGVSPAIPGLLSSLTQPSDPGAVSAWNDFLDVYLSRVDGKLSMNGENVRLLTSPSILKFFGLVQIPNSGQLLSDRFPAGRFRASANVPAVSGNFGNGISYISPHVGFRQPVWRNLQIIRDVYSDASSGQVAVTVVLLSNNVLTNAAPYKIHRFKVA